MLLRTIRRFQTLPVFEQMSFLLLLTANVMFTIAVMTHAWFELPGVAWYGLWWAKFCDVLGECHIIPAFFTKEPAFYHVMQVVFLLAWLGLSLSIYLLLSTRPSPRFPRYLRKNKHNSIAVLCFISVFAMSGGLYLFYNILNDLPRNQNIFPQMKWAAVFASMACGFEFVAGLLHLQMG